MGVNILFFAGDFEPRSCSLQVCLRFCITIHAGGTQRFFSALLCRLCAGNVNFFGPLGYAGKYRNLGGQNLCQPPSYGEAFGVAADFVTDLAGRELREQRSVPRKYTEISGASRHLNVLGVFARHYPLGRNYLEFDRVWHVDYAAATPLFIFSASSRTSSMEPRM